MNTLENFKNEVIDAIDDIDYNELNDDYLDDLFNDSIENIVMNNDQYFEFDDETIDLLESVNTLNELFLLDPNFYYEVESIMKDEFFNRVLDYKDDILNSDDFETINEILLDFFSILKIETYFVLK